MKQEIKEPTAEQLDAGAKALREKQMVGRITRAWADIPNAHKRKVEKAGG